MEEFTLTLYDKIKYYSNFLYDTYYLKLFPYTNVIIYNIHLNNLYHDETKRMNYISWGYDYYSKNIPTSKVLISYSGEKEFNTTFFAKSHREIEYKIKKILSENSKTHKKIKTKFPNFIEHVYFVYDENHDEKNILFDSIDIINNIIYHEDFDEENLNLKLFFSFGDLFNIMKKNIKMKKYPKKIKIVYVKMIKKMTIELDFLNNKDNDIDILNNIY
jgi:hypothetical protein